MLKSLNVTTIVLNSKGLKSFKEFKVENKFISLKFHKNLYL